MKTEKLWSGLIGGVLGFGIAWAGLGCLTTAFDFSPDTQVLAKTLLIWALLSAVCFSVKYGALVLTGITVPLGIHLIREGTILLELEALVYEITRMYGLAYGTPEVSWSGATLENVDITGGMILIGCLIVTAVCRAVCRRKRIYPALFLALLPLFACCVVTDTIPGAEYLFTLLGGLALLILTQSVRRTNGAAGVRLTAMLLIPVMLASAVLYRAVPLDGYEIQANSLQQRVLSWFNGLPFVVTQPDGNLGISFNGTPTESLNLANVGPKARLRYAVMDVVSDRTQTLYLRGQAFDVYDGMQWNVSEQVDYDRYGWPVSGMEFGGKVSVSTRTTRSMLFFPYYPAGEEWLEAMEDGAIPNGDGIKEYYFDQLVPMEPESVGVTGEMRQHFLELPQSTQAAAEEILKKVLGLQTGSDGEKISRIGEYVQNLVPYDLKTAQMPSEERDFAIWFLEDAESGYCIHYATAATVLLRAAGIPARYVTGYAVPVSAGVKKTVTADKAHAWVEYLDPDTNCWTVLDATPEEWSEEPTQPSETQPPETTEPTQETTAPSETQPPQTTEPSQTAEPTSQTEETAGGGTGWGSAQNADHPALWAALGAIMGITAVLGAAALQYTLRLQLRRRRFRKGTANRQAVSRWKYARRMGEVLQIPLPERLEYLAEKAVFSQHILTNEEIAEFDAWLQEARRTLQKKSWIRRVWIRLIWAAE